jgi:exonuclease VII large subunit
MSVFLGIVVMFVSTRISGPNTIKIGSISEEQNYVEITGEITKISTSESGTTFLTIRDETGSIDAVIFKNSIKNLDEIKEGKKFSVVGKTEKYKGEMELIVSSIN